MACYELANGYVLADEEIEQRAEQWEDGNWEGPLVTLHADRPRLSAEPSIRLSFKCPKSSADMIARAADAIGIKKSEFIRDAALEKAARVLAMAE